MHDIQQAAAAEASARNDATDPVMFRSMTQVAFPADLLRQLQENVSFDLGTVEDIRAAMQELSDRLNRRTGVLGQAVQSLDSGHN